MNKKTSWLGQKKFLSGKIGEVCQNLMKQNSFIRHDFTEQIKKNMIKHFIPIF